MENLSVFWEHLPSENILAGIIKINDMNLWILNKINDMNLWILK